MQASGALLWVGCWANPLIGRLNNSYLEGKKNRVRLKLGLIKNTAVILLARGGGYLIIFMVCTVFMFLCSDMIGECFLVFVFLSVLLMVTE